jgi:hypothetical protein
MVVSVLGAAAAILTGAAASIIQGRFRKPEQAALVTETNVTTIMKLLQQNQELAESNAKLMRSHAKLDRSLAKMNQELLVTREAMRLFLDVVERVAPALRETADDNMYELAHAMELARTALNGDHK